MQEKALQRFYANLPISVAMTTATLLLLEQSLNGQVQKHRWHGLPICHHFFQDGQHSLRIIVGFVSCREGQSEGKGKRGRRWSKRMGREEGTGSGMEEEWKEGEEEEGQREGKGMCGRRLRERMGRKEGT